MPVCPNTPRQAQPPTSRAGRGPVSPNTGDGISVLGPSGYAFLKKTPGWATWRHPTPVEVSDDDREVWLIFVHSGAEASNIPKLPDKSLLPSSCVLRNSNRLCRARIHARPAIAASIGIHDGLVIFDFNRAERAHLHTLSATCAGFYIHHCCHRSPFFNKNLTLQEKPDQHL